MNAIKPSPESQRGLPLRYCVGIFFAVGIAASLLIEASGEKHGSIRSIAMDWFGLEDYTSSDTYQVPDATRQVEHTTVILSKEAKAAALIGAPAGALAATIFYLLRRRK